MLGLWRLHKLIFSSLAVGYLVITASNTYEENKHLIPEYKAAFEEVNKNKKKIILSSVLGALKTVLDES